VCGGSGLRNDGEEECGDLVRRRRNTVIQSVCCKSHGFSGGYGMPRRLSLGAALFFVCCSAGAQQYAQHSGPKEYFGNEKLFSIEVSGSDTIEYFLLYKEPFPGGSYDGKIRKETDIPGGGYTNDELEFMINCGNTERTYDPNVTIFDFVKKARIEGPREQAERTNEWESEYVVDRNILNPPRVQLKGYNLWWAACKSQFLKFR
jgi:hypothetical protein